MGRNQFTFYASFASALGRIKKKSDRADAYDAICNYALFEIEPDLDKLPDSAAIAFDLIRPTLDSSRRKAESGKRGGSVKQTGSKQEASRKLGETGTEKEGEIEKENECKETSPVGDVKKAAAYYLDRVNPMASRASLEELAGFESTMGTAVCQRAIDIALDERKASWSYIRAILRDKQAKGVRSLADWDGLEAKREGGGNDGTERLVTLADIPGR